MVEKWPNFGLGASQVIVAIAAQMHSRHPDLIPVYNVSEFNK